MDTQKDNEDCLNWRVRGGLIDNVTFKLRSEEKVRPNVKIWAVRVVLYVNLTSVLGNGMCEVPTVGLSLVNMKT